MMILARCLLLSVLFLGDASPQSPTQIPVPGPYQLPDLPGQSDAQVPPPPVCASPTRPDWDQCGAYCASTCGSGANVCSCYVDRNYRCGVSCK